MYGIYLVNYVPYIAIFYFIIFFNYINDVLGCSIKKNLSNNYLLKHLITFLGLFIFIAIDNEKHPPLTSLLITIPLYILFLINTRGNYIFIIVNLLLTFILFLIEKSRIYYLNDKKILNDEDNDKLKKIEIIIFVIIIIISFIGYYNYIIDLRKSNINFTFKKFFTGKIKKC